MIFSYSYFPWWNMFWHNVLFSFAAKEWRKKCENGKCKAMPSAQILKIKVIGLIITDKKYLCMMSSIWVFVTLITISFRNRYSTSNSLKILVHTSWILHPTTFFCSKSWFGRHYLIHTYSKNYFHFSLFMKTHFLRNWETRNQKSTISSTKWLPMCKPTFVIDH